MPEQTLPAEYMETEEAEPEAIEDEQDVMAVSPLAPDWILMLFFAMFVDALDVLITLLGILDLWTISTLVSWLIDGAICAIIGGWMMWRIGKVAKSKKQRQEALVKKMEKQITRLKEMGKDTKTAEAGAKLAQQTLSNLAKGPAMKALRKAGAAILGELIPFVGLVPFWTISVFLMLREKGE